MMLRRYDRTSPHIDHNDTNRRADMLEGLMRNLPQDAIVTSQGQFVRRARGAIGRAGGVIIKITELHPDYVIGNLMKLDEDNLVVEDTDTTIIVAKTYGCQRTPFDGETLNGYEYSYSSDTERESRRVSDDDVELQEVTPPYYVGEQIMAQPNWNPLIVVPGEGEEPDTVVTYMEISPRTFARVEEE
jgi:hypothetical protein